MICRRFRWLIFRSLSTQKIVLLPYRLAFKYIYKAHTLRLAPETYFLNSYLSQRLSFEPCSTTSRHLTQMLRYIRARLHDLREQSVRANNSSHLHSTPAFYCSSKEDELSTELPRWITPRSFHRHSCHISQISGPKCRLKY